MSVNGGTALRTLLFDSDLTCAIRVVNTGNGCRLNGSDVTLVHSHDTDLLVNILNRMLHVKNGGEILLVTKC